MSQKGTCTRGGGCEQTLCMTTPLFPAHEAASNFQTQGLFPFGCVSTSGSETSDFDPRKTWSRTEIVFFFALRGACLLSFNFETFFLENLTDDKPESSSFVPVLQPNQNVRAFLTLHGKTNHNSGATVGCGLHTGQTRCPPRGLLRLRRPRISTGPHGPCFGHGRHYATGTDDGRPCGWGRK